MDSRTEDCEQTTTLCAFQWRRPCVMVRSENLPDARELFEVSKRLFILSQAIRVFVSGLPTRMGRRGVTAYD